jgi:hypothetical protein
MRITLESNIAQVRAALTQFSDRRFNSAIATALTGTARAVGDEWTKQLTSKLDRPTAATKRAVLIKRAENTAISPVAEVLLKNEMRSEGATAPAQWLAEHELGGMRGVKKFEAALQAQGSMPKGWKTTPGPAAKLDAYGNVSRSQIIQVIAQLGAQFSPGYQRVISASAARRAARAAKLGRAYVAILPGNAAKLTPGVYERAGRNIRAVFWYVPTASYTKRLDLLSTARRTVGPLFQREFEKAVAKSAERLAAAKGGRL